MDQAGFKVSGEALYPGTAYSPSAATQEARLDSPTAGGDVLNTTEIDDKVLILVVEQDPHMRKLEKFFLNQAGFRVEFADDGRQGLERARVLKPLLLVTEIMLPTLDGLRVCRALKADSATRHIKVLVFSILSAEDRALKAGADAFLTKPLDDALLVATVSRLIPKS
jgi:CheY-like chemotaxis protein